MGERVIPEEWVKTSVGEISSDISYGYTAKSTINPTGINFLRITDIQNNAVDWEKVPYCKIDDFKKENYLLKTLDIVFARTGATVGKSFLIDEKIPETVCASYLIRVRADKNVSVYYLNHFFKSQNYWNQITEFSSGIGQPNVNGTKLKLLKLPFPPLSEQKEIAKRLDLLLGQVDTIKSRIDGIPTILKSFRQSVLAAAVSGKLTEDWRGSQEYVMTNFNFYIPKKWEMLTIKDIGDVKGGKRLPKGEKLTLNNTGFPYIRAGQLKNGTVQHKDQLYLEPHIQKQISRYTVNAGDAYITIVGACIGDTGLISQMFDGANLTENAAKICNYKEEIDNVFLSYYLQSYYVQHIIHLETKSAAQGKLALKRIKELPFPHPALEEQKEIVKQVESFFALADSIEKKVKEAQFRVDNMTQSILAKAFSGELTKKWREKNESLITGENSAAALLEKIREVLD